MDTFVEAIGNFANRGGLELIEEEPYTFDNLKKFIQTTTLADKCKDFLQTEDVKQACNGFLKLLEQQTNLDDMCNLFVTASMLYYIQPSLENYEIRAQLLHETFQHVDTLNPMHLHFACERMLNNLVLPNRKHLFNLWEICQRIVNDSCTGKAVSVCLAWTLLCEITNTESNMHRFHRFSELPEMLQYLNNEALKRGDNQEILYLAVNVVVFLINIIVFGQNDELKNAGYGNFYFSYCLGDLKRLESWAGNLYELLNANKSPKYYDLQLYILENLQYNIKGLLNERISDLQCEADAIAT